MLVATVGLTLPKAQVFQSHMWYDENFGWHWLLAGSSKSAGEVQVGNKRLYHLEVTKLFLPLPHRPSVPAGRLTWQMNNDRINFRQLKHKWLKWRVLLLYRSFHLCSVSLPEMTAQAKTADLLGYGKTLFRNLLFQKDCLQLLCLSFSLKAVRVELDDYLP